MNSSGHGSTNSLRNVVKTVRTLVNDRREYVVGITLLLAVVVLWALSSFITQVRVDPFESPLYATDQSVVWCRIFSKGDTKNRSCASES